MGHGEDECPREHLKPPASATSLARNLTARGRNVFSLLLFFSSSPNPLLRLVSLQTLHMSLSPIKRNEL